MKDNNAQKSSKTKTEKKNNTTERTCAPDLLPVKNDYVFANLFGARSHKRVLVCLLNSILNGKPHIEDVTLDPTEYKKTSPDGKSIRLDIAATSDDGTILNVEIQCIEEGNIADRASFYQSVLRTKNLKEGEDYSDIPNIISIWITVDPVTKRKGCCHEIVDMYKDNGVDPVEIASEKMRHFIIEMTKLEATPKRFLNDMFTVWIQFTRDPNSIPPEFLGIPEVKEAMDELTKMSADEETRREYESRVKEMNRIYAAKRASFKKGKAEGRAEGEKIGEARGIEKGKAEGEKIGIEKGKEEERAKAYQEKLESAKELLSMGVPMENVSRALGLSLEELRKLR